MRRGQVHALQQFARHSRFAFPGIEVNAQVFSSLQQSQQCPVVDHLTARGVYQYTIIDQPPQPRRVKQVKGRVVAVSRERHVQADEIAFAEDGIQGHESLLRFAAALQRRIAQQALDAECVELDVKARADVAEADDACFQAQRVETFLPR